MSFGIEMNLPRLEITRVHEGNDSDAEPTRLVYAHIQLGPSIGGLEVVEDVRSSRKRACAAASATPTTFSSQIGLTSNVHTSKCTPGTCAKRRTLIPVRSGRVQTPPVDRLPWRAVISTMKLSSRRSRRHCWSSVSPRGSYRSSSRVMPPVTVGGTGGDVDAATTSLTAPPRPFPKTTRPSSTRRARTLQYRSSFHPSCWINR